MNLFQVEFTRDDLISRVSSEFLYLDSIHPLSHADFTTLPTTDKLIRCNNCIE